VKNLRGISKRPKTLENVLTTEEVDLLKQNAVSVREKLIVNGLLYTGMRINEFIHLNRDWIDFKAHHIRIPGSMPCQCRYCGVPEVNSKGKITRPAGVWRPKTVQGARLIPIAPEVLPWLKEYFGTFKSVMQMIPSRGSAHYHLKMTAQRAGITHPVFPHALRGTFASTLAMKGFDPFEMKEIMGWKGIEASSSYVRLFGDHIQKVFDKKWKGSE